MPKNFNISPQLKLIFRSAIEFVIEQNLKSNTLMKQVATYLKRPESPKNSSQTLATKAVVRYTRAFDKSVKHSEHESINKMFHTGMTAVKTGVGNCHEMSCLVFTKVFQTLFRLQQNNDDVMKEMKNHVFIYCGGVHFDHGFSLLLTQPTFEKLMDFPDDDDKPFLLKDLIDDEQIMVVDPWFESVYRQAGRFTRPFDLTTLKEAVASLKPNDGAFEIEDDWEFPTCLTEENANMFNQVIQAFPTAFQAWTLSEKSKQVADLLYQEASMNKKAMSVQTDGRSLSPITVNKNRNSEK